MESECRWVLAPLSKQRRYPRRPVSPDPVFSARSTSPVFGTISNPAHIPHHAKKKAPVWELSS